jgi:hypothetical protein
MSMPSFPEINPDITRENAINMIITSIAMEELALSHIMNAEGEKLQYVLKKMESCDDSCDNKYSIKELLLVNKSITDLLDSVSQNQMLLKSKMNRALDALDDKCQEHGNFSPPYCKKCSASFETDCKKWHHNSALNWNTERLHGECVRIVPNKSCEIEVLKAGRYMLNISLNLKVPCNCDHDIVIALQAMNNKTLYTFHNSISKLDTVHTISMGGMLVDITDTILPYRISLKLISPDFVAVEHAILNIAEQN